MSDETHGAGAEPREGRYANYFKVGYNAFEVVMDFGQLYPEGHGPWYHTRVVTNPIYARALLRTLNDSLDGYEAAFGPIPSGEGDEGAEHSPERS